MTRAAAAKIRAVIVDDEELARQVLREFIAAHTEIGEEDEDIFSVADGAGRGWSVSLVQRLFTRARNFATPVDSSAGAVEADGEELAFVVDGRDVNAVADQDVVEGAM